MLYILCLHIDYPHLVHSCQCHPVICHGTSVKDLNPSVAVHCPVSYLGVAVYVYGCVTPTYYKWL